MNMPFTKMGEVVPLPVKPADPDQDTTEDQDAPESAPGSVTDADGSDEPWDAESALVQEETVGGPVDPPDVAGAGAPRERAPVLPPEIASAKAARGTAKWMWSEAQYQVKFHAVRSPKYGVKVVGYAVPGAGKTVVRLVKWASGENGNWVLRQAAASAGDAQTWLKLDARRRESARWRWPVLVAGAAGAVFAAGALYGSGVPLVGKVAATLLVLVLLARAGRPEDKPITDRVTTSGGYRKLTAELVRRALVHVQLSGITSAVAKNPGAISFPVEIHRDGPGHLAIVDLPYGVEAADVIARRGKLASGLRLPLDQVWPEPGQGHTGRLALWVGFEPASQMRQPAWPLLKGDQVDVFKPFAFATTPRMDVVNASLMYRNWLFGGQPGSGKTFALRLLALAAALDPRAELRIYEMKGVGDFKTLAPVCAEYGNGFDDDTLAACAKLIDWLYEECKRRSKRIDHYAAIGKAPENKVTPELASLKDSGLHPLVVCLDELQELMLSPHGKRAGEILEKVIKLGRALGVILIIGTQIPDKDSLPTGITRNVNTRFCLSVADQTANDMILGTSQYKLGFRATVFKPGPPSEGGEAGWGILRGIGETGARRSYYIDTDQAARIISHAVALRTAAGTLPEEGTQTREVAGYDVLADVAAIWPAGEDAAWNETLLEALTALRPEVYTGWEPAQLTAALAIHGVTVRQIGRRIDGKTVNRRGPDHHAITTAITDRKQNPAAG